MQRYHIMRSNCESSHVSAIPPIPQPAASHDTPTPQVGSILGSIGDHWSSRQKHKLLLVEVKIFGRKVVALVDSGATHNFIASEFCYKHGMRYVKKTRTVVLADGSNSEAVGALQSARVTIGQHAVKEDFIVMDMKGEEFQCILGKPWLSAVNPTIDWSKNCMTIRDSVICGVDKFQPSPTVKVCSLRSVLKATKQKGARAWTVLIRPVQDKPKEETPSDTPYSPSLLAPDWSVTEKQLHDWPELYEALRDYEDVFQPLPDGLPPQKKVTHKIEIPEGAKPPYRPPYRMSPLELDELKKQVEGLLDKGWIRPSHSPFGAPVLFAAKPDGSLRLCIDYRALNALTKKSRYPIPRIDEMFDRLGPAKYISHLDAAQAYHQVPIAEGDQEKTAFVTRYGQFEWVVMPFGLCNAPSTFQSLINQVLGSDFDDFTFAYLDDIMAWSQTREEHVRHLRAVLQKLRESSIRLRLSKCKFGVQQTEFLGFIVGNGKIAPSPSKVAAVTEWPTPKDVHTVRSFLGFANFYRRFVKDYSKITAPLNDLLRKGVSWNWCEKCESAFSAIKEKLTSAPALLLPDLKLPFYVVCDASDYAIGCTLMQDQGHGLHPVAYDGRKMSPAEVNYHTTDKENLGLVYALRRWRCYLEGREFIVETDHDALRFLQTKRPEDVNRRQARWLEMLGSYNFKVIHKPGKLNVSDPLSRRQYPDDPDKATIHAISSAEFGDDFMAKVLHGYEVDNLYCNPRNLRQFQCKDGYWYWNGRLCIPSMEDDSLIEVILKELHDSATGGHFGFDKTYAAISKRFYWPQMKRDIREYIRTCPVCMRAKHDNQRPAGLLQPLPVPNHPWEQHTMDLLLKLPMSDDGHDAAIVFVDRFTKSVVWEPCTKTITAEGVARIHLKSVIRHHGVPSVIVSDRDPRLTSGFWEELQRLVGTSLKMSTRGHAETDGQSENSIKTMLRMLRSYIEANPKNWDKLLCMAEFAYNSSVQASTGFTPFFAMYGREPKLPIDTMLPTERKSVEELITNIHSAMDLIKQNLHRAQQHQCRVANKRRRDVHYAVGDKVLLRSNLFTLKMPKSKKVMPPYVGPFTVTAVTGPVNVKLDLPRQFRMHNVFHVSKVKPFHETARFGNRGAPPPFDMIDGEQEYEVEALIGRKDVRGRRYYLVKWVGLDHCEDMWIRREHLNNAMDLVTEYDAAHPV